MYKFDIGIDPKEAAAISRRRRCEEERKKRIFNPMERMFGKDLAALEKQSMEKKWREEQEKKQAEAYELEAIRQSLVAKELEKQMKDEARKVHEKLQNYRLHYQRYEDRREYDLNDPEMIKNSIPARLHDDDPRCGVSSAQKFEGEDLCYKERLQEQEVQKKRWLDAQIREKKMNDQERARAEELLNNRLVLMSERAKFLENAEMEAKNAVAEATKQFNYALGKEMAYKREQEKRAEEDAALAHQLREMRSDLLTEVTYPAPCGKIPRENFKGFTQDEINRIREEQERQIQELRDRKGYERKAEENWENLKIRQSIAALMLERDLKQRHLEHLRQLKRNNYELGREQRNQQDYLNKVLYANNTPTEEFFRQFNTTSR